MNAKLLFDGKEVSFESARLAVSLIDNVSRSLSIVIKRPIKNKTLKKEITNVIREELPINTLIQLKLNDTVVFTGYEANLKTSENPSQYEVSIECESKAMYFFKSNIPRNQSFQGVKDILSLSQEIARRINYTIVDADKKDPAINEIAIINNVFSGQEIKLSNIAGYAEKFNKGSNELVLVKTTTNQIIFNQEWTALEGIQRYANQNNILLRDDENGNVVLYKLNYENILPITTLNRRINPLPTDPQNNIESAQVVENLSDRSQVYFYYSKNFVNLVTGTGKKKRERKAPSLTSVVDSEIKIPSFKSVSSWDNRVDAELTQSIGCIASVQKSRSKMYNVVVNGFTHGGYLNTKQSTIWQAGDVVNVYDEVQGFNCLLVVTNVDIEINGGLTPIIRTKLTLSEPNIFTSIGIE